MAGECESFSVSPLADNWINCTFTGLPVYNMQAVTYQLLSCPPKGATNLLGNQELPDLSSSSLCLLLLAGSIGLMVTQATKFNKTSSGSQ